jgi:hypothetical protein
MFDRLYLNINIFKLPFFFCITSSSLFLENFSTSVMFVYLVILLGIEMFINFYLFFYIYRMGQKTLSASLSLT